ncbi:MAG: hypothetical protein IPI52_06640 [Bacteroidetes bacterium]|nr:hypothetical protein [Bacteroidota bacterium]
MRDYIGWVKAAFPWALFSAAILGTAILMGGAWRVNLKFWWFLGMGSKVEKCILSALDNFVVPNHTHNIQAPPGTYFMFILSFLLIRFVLSDSKWYFGILPYSP